MGSDSETSVKIATDWQGNSDVVYQMPPWVADELASMLSATKDAGWCEDANKLYAAADQARGQ